VDLGAYELQSLPSLEVALQSDYTSVTVGYRLHFSETVWPRTPTALHWDFGDGTSLDNRTNVIHQWNAPGDYPVVLTAYDVNNNYSNAVSASLLIHVVANFVYYVDANGTNPVAPFASWDTAATTIQQAVDAAFPSPRSTVMVTNGTYFNYGRYTPGAGQNTVIVDKPIAMQSVNGPDVTSILGGFGGVDGQRCVYLAGGSVMSGFTLAGGNKTDLPGGGVYCESTSVLLTNCVINDSSATYDGGGVCGGTLIGCVISGNSSSYTGGGVINAILQDCTLSGNSSGRGGAANGCSLVNCALNNNSAIDGGGADNCTLNNCTLTGNFASGGGGYHGGGGLADSTATHCLISGNTAGALGGGASYSRLSGCSIFGNYSQNNGGGVLNSSLDHCYVTNNSAALSGGGAESSTLDDCLVAGNLAWDYSGGGADDCALTNCTVVYNSAPNGVGGANACTLQNCIVYANGGTNYDASSVMNYCCTAPLPAGGVHNFTNDPVLVNPSGNDFHLQTNSPCVNAGDNSSVNAVVDLGGRPRVADGVVDVGAYESQGAFNAWLARFGLPTDGSADFADSDGDGLNNWQEWLAGTNPTNAQSVLQVLSLSTGGDITCTVTWQSVAGKIYFVQRASDLTAQPAFSTILDNITGQDGTTSCIDATATNSGPYFYRVGVH
jgi:hypothetical protein